MPLNHIKPHGSLYGMAARDPEDRQRGLRRGRCVQGAAARHDRDGAREGLPGPRPSLHRRVLCRSRLRRRRAPHHHARTRGRSILRVAADRAVRALERGRRRSVGGKDITVRAETICVHSDTPGADLVAKAVHDRLGDEGFIRAALRHALSASGRGTHSWRSRPFEAPIPGTFYRRPAPDQPPFKGEGDDVAVGDTIGLIEVMKTFSAVIAEASGKIVRIPCRERGSRDGRPAALRPRGLSAAMADPDALRRQSRARSPSASSARRRRSASRTVQAVSAADKEMLAARTGGRNRSRSVRRTPTKSYLNKEAVVAAAVASGADAVHPGYGFLSENADFADEVEAAGLIFVGPQRRRRSGPMGDKAVAREIAARAGVPTVPGSDGRIEDVEAALAPRRSIGYPLMIKAAAGGGGRGIRMADTPAELESADPAGERRGAARRSATAAFTSSASSRARDISRCKSSATARTRSISSSANARCSAADRKSGRKRPPRCLTPDLREALCASAVRLAKSVRYRGAGTLEYLYDEAARRVLLHRDEHPHPGRASGDRDDHRHRPGAGDDPHRGRRAAALTANPTSPFVATRSRCASTPRIRRGTSCRRPAGSTAFAMPGGSGVRFDTLLYEGYVSAALLRQPARQADRGRRDREPALSPGFAPRWAT